MTSAGNALNRFAVVATVVSSLVACAGSSVTKPVDDVPFLERSHTQEIDGVSITAAVPSAAESVELFGTPLYKKGVQPVWLEISNDTGNWISFLPAGLDEDYLSPLEVASVSRSAKDRNSAEKFFFQTGLDLQIAAGETRKGFIFTSLDEGTKAFNIDIIGDSRSWQFTFFIQVPGLAIDHHDIDFGSLYADEEITHYSDAELFRDALKALPCCTMDAASKNNGDPVNLVIIGEPADIYYAAIRAGWDETEVVSAASGFKTAMSFITGGEYRYSPVSNLYVFGRSQDVALQRIRSSINERNHFRLWLAPMTFQGRSVFIGQISRDIGVRLTTKTITTHKIDANVDETREFLVENLAYHQMLNKLAYAEGVGMAAFDAPRQNLTGDPYYTDGLRVVMWIEKTPTDLQDIGSEDWIWPDD